jgi:branched-chain amino acid transport system substrate-binding protein
MKTRIFFFHWLMLLIFTYCNFATAKTIKIALVIPLSGNYTGYGNQLLAGAAQAVKDINKTGGILGDTLEIVPYDDKCQPAIAGNIAKELAKDQHIHAIIGHVTSATALAALDNYAEAKKLFFTVTATNPQITQKNIPTVFRVSGRDDHQGLAIAKFIAHNLHSKRIAILHDQDLYGKELADYVIEHLALLEQHPVLYYGVPHGTKNFSKIIAKFKELAIDAVFFAGLYPEVGNLAKAMHTQHLQIPLISGDGIALNSFVITAGNRHATTSVIMSFNQDAKTISNSLPIIEKMRKSHLETNGYTLYAYSAVQAIAAAMQATKSANGIKLAKWLHSNTVNTALGVKSWDTNGDIINAEYQMYIWNNDGHYKPLD